ncbi:hypothetical protein [Bilophila sp.]|uniref:hypothetical protein n=1 Tax=Bilophila sp. TaxID=1929485 RepID=UPI003076A855
MLTEQEKRWLRERDLRATPCDNELPGIICDCCVKSIGTVCPLKPDYRDAAEFAERVAATTANGAQIVDDPFMLLKYSRLYVEEEMDNERNHA